MIQNLATQDQIIELNTNLGKLTDIEKVVGKLSDGSVVYEKTVSLDYGSNFVASSSFTNIQLNHGISGITKVISFNACFSRVSDGRGYNLPYCSDDGTIGSACILVTKTQAEFKNKVPYGVGAYNLYLTVRYTK